MPFKSQKYNNDEIYPEYFTEEDKIRFDELLAESRVRHSKEFAAEPALLKYAIVCYINGENKRGVDVDEEEVKKLKEIYKVDKRTFETPPSEEYKDPEKFLINLPDDELKKYLNIENSVDTSNILYSDTLIEQDEPQE
jgi:hypothetical protein